MIVDWVEGRRMVQLCSPQVRRPYTSRARDTKPGWDCLVFWTLRNTENLLIIAERSHPDAPQEFAEERKIGRNALRLYDVTSYSPHPDPSAEGSPECIFGAAVVLRRLE